MESAYLVCYANNNPCCLYKTRQAAEDFIKSDGSGYQGGPLYIMNFAFSDKEKLIAPSPKIDTYMSDPQLHNHIVTLQELISSISPANFITKQERLAALVKYIIELYTTSHSK
jgi:hypothetical protein